jgi:hypothetical protein
MAEMKRYKIKIDSRTEITVLGHQLYKERWIKHFGSIENVTEFIKNYDKEKNNGY